MVNAEVNDPVAAGSGAGGNQHADGVVCEIGDNQIQTARRKCAADDGGGTTAGCGVHFLRECSVPDSGAGRVSEKNGNGI